MKNMQKIYKKKVYASKVYVFFSLPILGAQHGAKHVGKMMPKSIKMCPKSVYFGSRRRSWGHPGGPLGGPGGQVGSKTVLRPQKWKFWPSLGGHLGGQNRSKIEFKAILKVIFFDIFSRIDFWRHLEPAWGHLGPTWAQLEANLSQLEANLTPTWANLRPTWPNSKPLKAHSWRFEKSWKTIGF